MKNNKGAISIEMIITVIVILVLLGICVFMLTGEEGIFVPKKDEQVQENNITETNQTQNNVQNAVPEV